MDKLMSAAGASNVNKKTDTIELLPHNQMLYDKIVAEMEKGEHSIFYSEATGLGKSFIFMRLVQDYFSGKRVMYVVPKISIWKNLIRYKEFETLNADIDMVTYASFNKYDKSLCDEYDVVFVDECHHMLSEIQGNNLYKFCKDMNTLNKYSFGFTATPYYKGKYVDEECFDVSCYGYDICEAIDLGLLPKIHFSVANIDIDSIPMNMKARYSITGTKTLLEQLLSRNINKHRWIAYFLNKTELEQNVHELQTLFPDYTVLKVYDGIEDEDAVYDTFNNSEGKVILLSVNKLLEGVHLRNVQGVLLYRNVTEFSTYMQMYGRLCEIFTKESPIFLDVANAIFSVNKASEEKDTFKSNRVGGRTKRKLRDFFDVHAEDYWTVELMDMILELQPAREALPWTEEEDDILRQYYPIEKTACYERLPNRSFGACKNRVRILNLTDSIKWTEDEDNILREEYLSRGMDVRDKLPNRSESAIKNRIYTLGIKSHTQLTQDELTRLAYLYENRTYCSFGKELEKEFPGRSASTLYSALRKMGYDIHADGVRAYSVEEKSLISSMIRNGYTLDDIVEELNKQQHLINVGITRTKTGIRMAVNNEEHFPIPEVDKDTIKKYYPIEGKDSFRRLSQIYLPCQKEHMARVYGAKLVSRWTPEEDKILIDNYAEMGLSVNTLLSGRTAEACGVRAGQLGLVNKKRWTEEEDSIIKANLHKTRDEIAKLLPGRTPGQVGYRISRLGLGVNISWLEEEISLFKSMKSDGYSHDDIVDKLNQLPVNMSRGIIRTKSSVNQLSSKLK